MIRYRPTVVEVDLDAIRHNVRAVKPAGSELMAVVKADAYGHGDVQVARAAVEAGATWLGVALVEEGLSLREAGIASRVLMLSEFPPGSEKDALAADLTPTIYSHRGLDAVTQAAGALGVDVSVHIKLDTGMHRVGVYPAAEAVDFAKRALEAGLLIEGLWTHFAVAEENEVTTRLQLARFIEQVDALDREGIKPRYLHAANSGATLLYPETHLHLVRPGILIYGLMPAPGLPSAPDLHRALTWRSAVTMSKRLPAGESVSYGHAHTLARDATIVTVPVGYEDGYSRRMSNKASVLIRGKRHPVAGNVTMDQVLVDCGDVDVAEGEDVVLLGRQGEEEITAEELAELSGTLHYEIFCGISERVPREYTGLA